MTSAVDAIIETQLRLSLKQKFEVESVVTAGSCSYSYAVSSRISDVVASTSDVLHLLLPQMDGQDEHYTDCWLSFVMHEKVIYSFLYVYIWCPFIYISKFIFSFTSKSEKQSWKTAWCQEKPPFWPEDVPFCSQAARWKGKILRILKGHSGTAYLSQWVAYIRRFTELNIYTYIYIYIYTYIYTSTTGDQSLHKVITWVGLAGLTRVTNIFSRPQKKIWIKLRIQFFI